MYMAKSGKIKTVADSSTAAEIGAGHEMTKFIVWQTELAESIGFKFLEPVPMEGRGQQIDESRVHSAIGSNETSQAHDDADPLYHGEGSEWTGGAGRVPNEGPCRRHAHKFCSSHNNSQ